ncbi:MAG TPA: pyridoxamine 5'-phosphate oxidase family protein [Candidatus Limnocylindrales bacterium]|nr:pyridoxamine 5'-phosphate oxidase family protein [Candidatus Limnocylindrales bacterium]
MDREALLERPLVAVFAVRRPDGRVHATPLWFDWDFKLIVERDSPRHRWSVAAGRAALCIETDDAGELSFVTAEGPVTVVDPLTKETRFRIWERYRGPHRAREVVDAGGHETKVLLLVRPETWIGSP